MRLKTVNIPKGNSCNGCSCLTYEEASLGELYPYCVVQKDFLVFKDKDIYKPFECICRLALKKYQLE